MNPVEIIVVVRTSGGSTEFHKVPVEKYTNIMELVQPQSKL